MTVIYLGKRVELRYLYVSYLWGFHGGLDREQTTFKLPSDILTIWNSTSSSNPSSFSKALRVTEEDLKELIQTPRVDAAVIEHLPQSGKAAPPGYSPFWEGELSNLDTRLAAGVRLGSVATVTADHLSRTLASQGGADHPLVQEAKLLTEFNMHLLRVAMSARRHITELRRQQVLEHMGPHFGDQFLKLVKDRTLALRPTSLVGSSLSSSRSVQRSSPTRPW
jgi:hypothetical protein